MTFPTRLWNAIDDRLNPIVVKELRQAVQGRFMAAVLLFFLAFQLVILGIFLINEGTTVDLISAGRQGAEVFTAVIVVLLVATMICIPVFTGIRFTVENTGDAFGLLYISTLSPRRIISGKVLASSVLVLLVFSACLPFVSFTYFLRGIDLISVLIVLAMDFLIAVTTIQVMIFLACLRTGRWFKVLLGIGALVGLMIAFGFAVTFSVDLPNEGIGSRVGTSDFWIGTGVFLTLDVLLIGLLFVLSAAVISPPVMNRALPVRLYLTASWWITGGLAVYSAIELGDVDYLTVWLVIYLVVGSTALLAAISAPDELGRRVAMEIPQSRFRRWLVFPFWSGAASGTAWSLLTILLSLTVGSLMQLRNGMVSVELADTIRLGSGVVAYVVAYSLTGLLLHRRFLSARILHRYTWFVALVLATIGCLVPILIAIVVSPEVVVRQSFDGWLILNPLAPMSDEIGEIAVVFGVCWAGLMLLLLGTWFWRQVRAFERPETAGGG